MDEAQQYEEKVIQISRVSKKTKGGNQIGFSVLMVVGDRKGNVGVGLGKAPDVVSAIRKGVKRARKKMIKIPLDGTTIPFPIRVNHKAAEVLLKPAPRGTGVIAGGPVRAVVEAAGVRDISGKIMGTDNQASNVYATFEALREIRKIVKIKDISLKSVAEAEAEEAKKTEALQEKHKKRAHVGDETTAKEATAKDSATNDKPAASTKKPVKTKKSVEAKKPVKKSSKKSSKK